MYRYWFSLRDIFDSFPPEVNVVKEINFITKFVRLVGPHSKKNRHLKFVRVAVTESVSLVVIRSESVT